MPRPRRLVVPGQPLHVIQRGNNRAVTFNATLDYRIFKLLLRQESRRADCAIHAYVFMRNHVHLLLTPDDARGPARMMQAIGTRYVRYFNRRYARTGTLWEGRFRSTLVDSQRYLFACSRYIELNPVRAQIVDRPGLYAWSSFRHNATGEPDAILTPHPLYLALGARGAERRSAYRTMFAEELGPDALEAIRKATNSGAVLGTATFREQIEDALRRHPSRWPRGGDRRSASFLTSHERWLGEGG